MVDTNDNTSASPLILSWSELSEPPQLFLDSFLQEGLARANTLAADAARARVSAALSIDLTDQADQAEEADSGPSPRLGVLAGWQPPEDIMALAQQVVAGSTAAGKTAARLVFPEGSAPLGPGIDTADSDTADSDTPESGAAPRVDLRRPAHLLRRLDQGWTLEAQEPVGLAPELSHLVGDLETAFGPVMVTFSLGLRSALGAAPSANPGGCLFVQLAGTRALLLRGEADQQQFRVGAGQVVWVPSPWVAQHLPLDADSAHLTIALAQSPLSTSDRSAPGEPAWSDQTEADPAMYPARASYDMAGARGFFAADPAAGWMFRWAAPAGALAAADQPDPTNGRSLIVAGGIALEVASDGLRLIETLAAGEWTTAAAISDTTNLDPVAVGAAIEELATLGLVTLAPARRDHRTNTFLNGVARGVSMPAEMVGQLIATIDEAKWRPPTPTEVRAVDTNTVQVQSLAPDGYPLVAEVVRAVAMLNAQFFGADINGQQEDDPPLMVRLRVGESGSPFDPLDSLGSDIEGDNEGRTNTSRKLTWVLSLSDAEGSAQGGWFVMPGGSDKVEPTPGEVSVFPAFRLWTLAPLEAGERLLLLGRLHGPAFR